MGYLFILFAALIFLLTTTQITSFSIAQQSIKPLLKPPTIDIKAVLFSVSPLITVEYQTDSTVVLKADEETLLSLNGTIMPFWNAIDLVKHYGYSLDDVTTSGMGSQHLRYGNHGLYQSERLSSSGLLL